MAGLFTSRPDHYQVDVTVVIQSIESGDLGNRIAFPLLLVLGLYFVLRRPSAVLHLNLTPWVGLYLIFLCLSMFWSWDPWLTLRRVAIPVCVVSFVLGIGAVYYGTKQNGYATLARTIVWTSSIASLMIVAASILHGDLRVTDPLWRLGREGAENLTAWVFGVGFLVVWATWSRTDIWPSRWEKFLHVSLLAGTLLLTKSRTTLVAMFLGIATIEWLKPQLGSQRVLRLAGFLMCFVAGGLVLMATPAHDALWARGNEESIDTLSGRLPLWESLWSVLSKHLWFGLGFGAFWSPKTVQAFASHWTPTATHNGYLELIADVGLVGLAASFFIAALSLRNGFRLLKYPLYREIGTALVALIVADMVVSLGMSWYLERFQEYPSIVILGLSMYVAHRVSVFDQAEETKRRNKSRALEFGTERGLPA
jgi:O-antigen ligase